MYQIPWQVSLNGTHDVLLEYANSGTLEELLSIYGSTSCCLENRELLARDAEHLEGSQKCLRIRGRLHGKTACMAGIAVVRSLEPSDRIAGISIDPISFLNPLRSLS